MIKRLIKARAISKCRPHICYLGYIPVFERKIGLKGVLAVAECVFICRDAKDIETAKEEIRDVSVPQISL